MTRFSRGKRHPESARKQCERSIGRRLRRRMRRLFKLLCHQSVIREPLSTHYGKSVERRSGLELQCHSRQLYVCLYVREDIAEQVVPHHPFLPTHPRPPISQAKLSHTTEQLSPYLLPVLEHRIRKLTPLATPMISPSGSDERTTSKSGPPATSEPLPRLDITPSRHSLRTLRQRQVRFLLTEWRASKETTTSGDATTT
jgi:hypothetical protein